MSDRASDGPRIVPFAPPRRSSPAPMLDDPTDALNDVLHTLFDEMLHDHLIDLHNSDELARVMLGALASAPHADPAVQARTVASIERVQVANAYRRVQLQHVRALLRHVTYVVTPETIVPYLEALRAPAAGARPPGA